jgi:uncharacterized membrane protein YdjX (TVP38/TMEM64 family)
MQQSLKALPNTPVEEAGSTPPQNQSGASGAAASGFFSSKSFLWLVLAPSGVAGLILIIHFTPLNGFFDQLQEFFHRLDDRGWWTEALFLAVNIIGVALGSPRLIFYALAGVVFQVWEGLLLAQLGTLAGSLLTFQFVRRTGRQWVQRRFGKDLEKLRRLNPESPWSVFLIRQLPISTVLMNLTFGLSAVRTRAFLAGSFLGFLPQGMVVLLVGAGVMEEDVMEGVMQLLLAGGLFVGLGVWRLWRKTPIESE